MCEFNKCDDYHYPGGTCLNIKSELYLNECKGCDYEEVQEMQEDDRGQSE